MLSVIPLPSAIFLVFVILVVIPIPVFTLQSGQAIESGRSEDLVRIDTEERNHTETPYPQKNLLRWQAMIMRWGCFS